MLIAQTCNKLMKIVTEAQNHNSPRTFFELWLAANGWNLIGSGSARKVYGNRQKTLAVKLMTFSATERQQNEVEAECAIQHPEYVPPVHAHLRSGPPIVPYGGVNFRTIDILLVDYAEMMPEEGVWRDATADVPRWHKIRELFQDVNWNNMGYLNGRLVLLDSGYGLNDWRT